jgi:tetratricopeptide (TPR) repeat protein
MKKLNQLAIWVLAATVAGVAQQPSTPPTTSQPPAPGAQPGQTTTTSQPPAAQPQQKKEIKDPAEYNAYVNAMGITEPATKANALEQFITQYPNSVVKDDALEQLMGAYQQSGNLPKAQDAATRVLQVNPNNVRALLVLAYTKRLSAQSGNAADAPLALQYGQQGLQALPNYQKPEGVPPADFDKLKSIAALVFNGAVGIGSLNAKDYPTAQKYLQTAYEMEVSANPNDPDAWLNAYPLATAFCSTKPVNPQGLWYGARAINLTKNNPQVNGPISTYVKHCYTYYHGDDTGWDQLLQQAAAQPNPPAGFTVAPAPTPAEQVKKIADSKDPKQMSFDDWKLIFTYGDPATTDRVWTAIKGTPLAFQALVIQAEKDRLIMAATYDGIQDQKADTEVVMAGPIPAAKMPKVGTQIAVVATPETYDKDPYMMHLDNGKLAVAKGAATPAHHPAARHRTKK